MCPTAQHSVASNNRLSPGHISWHASVPAVIGNVFCFSSFNTLSDKTALWCLFFLKVIQTVAIYQRVFFRTLFGWEVPSTM